MPKDHTLDIFCSHLYCLNTAHYPHKPLSTMLNWLSTVIFAKQVAKVVAIRLNALSRWHTVPSSHSIILWVDPVAPVHIGYLPAEYSFNSGFHFLIPGEVVTGIMIRVFPRTSLMYNPMALNSLTTPLPGKLDVNNSLRPPDYCSVFLVKVMAIYRAAQWILDKGVFCTSNSIFSDSLIIRPLITIGISEQL